jgi:hypothetical protein
MRREKDLEETQRKLAEKLGTRKAATDRAGEGADSRHYEWPEARAEGAGGPNGNPSFETVTKIVGAMRLSAHSA